MKRRPLPTLRDIEMTSFWQGWWQAAPLWCVIGVAAGIILAKVAQ
jgi:hypothetical protein